MEDLEKELLTKFQVSLWVLIDKKFKKYVPEKFIKIDNLLSPEGNTIFSKNDALNDISTKIQLGEDKIKGMLKKIENTNYLMIEVMNYLVLMTELGLYVNEKEDLPLEDIEKKIFFQIYINFFRMMNFHIYWKLKTELVNICVRCYYYMLLLIFNGEDLLSKKGKNTYCYFTMPNI